MYQYWNGGQVIDTLTARNAGGGGQRMPDKQNFNSVIDTERLTVRRLTPFRRREKTMSIEKDYDIYIAVCDICGDDIGPFEDFYDAVDAKKAAGWRSRKDAHGEWIDLCPACQHPSAASDFGGVI